MSEYAFYWYFTERADIEQIEDCDDNRDWPSTFEDFMEKIGNSILHGAPHFTEEELYERWRIGIWQEGFIHALAKIRRGDEDVGITWWNREYEEAGTYFK